MAIPEATNFKDAGIKEEYQTPDISELPVYSSLGTPTASAEPKPEVKEEPEKTEEVTKPAEDASIFTQPAIVEPTLPEVAPVEQSVQVEAPVADEIIAAAPAAPAEPIEPAEPVKDVEPETKSDQPLTLEAIQAGESSIKPIVQPESQPVIEDPDLPGIEPINNEHVEPQQPAAPEQQPVVPEQPVASEQQASQGAPANNVKPENVRLVTKAWNATADAFKRGVSRAKTWIAQKSINAQVASEGLNGEGRNR